MMFQRNVQSYNPVHKEFMKNYVVLSCQIIKFVMDDPRTKTLFNKSLRIYNPSEINNIRFKVKCTAPFNYIVKPFEQTLGPRQSMDITIRAVLGDREINKFNTDKFEVLSKVVTSEEETMLQKVFWEGAYSQRLDVEIFQPRAQTVNFTTEPVGQSPFEQAQREEKGRLDFECRQLQQKINILQNRSRDASFLKPKNFFVVGFISFFLGFIFA